MSFSVTYSWIVTQGSVNIWKNQNQRDKPKQTSRKECRDNRDSIETSKPCKINFLEDLRGSVQEAQQRANGWTISKNRKIRKRKLSKKYKTIFITEGHVSSESTENKAKWVKKRFIYQGASQKNFRALGIKGIPTVSRSNSYKGTGIRIVFISQQMPEFGKIVPSKSRWKVTSNLQFYTQAIN